MACMSALQPNQTLVQRIDQVDKALKRLEQYLTTGTVRIGISPQGAVQFIGWNDRDGLGDVCSFRSLSATNSWALRSAVLKAEGMSGRKVNMKAITAGLHSHDGGGTWEKH